MHISEFKKGDVIVRTKRANIELSKDPYTDGSYVGDMAIFRGVQNGVIYLWVCPAWSPKTRQSVTLPEDFWSEGWEYYEPIEDEVTEIVIALIEKLTREEKYEELGRIHEAFNM